MEVPLNPKALDESARLSALHRYQVLDTEPEPAFDDLARLAALFSGCPISLITFVEADRVWHKAAVGLAGRQWPREGSFGTVVIAEGRLVVAPDASQDERFKNHPLVSGPEAVRFFAGVPIQTADGYSLGVLSVMDRQPRELTAPQREALEMLARQIVAQLELRVQVAQLERESTRARQAADALGEAEARYRSIFDHVNEGIFQTSPDGRYLAANPMLAKIYGYASPQELMTSINDLAGQIYVKPGRRDEFISLLQADDSLVAFESEIRRKDGSIIWISENARAIRDAEGRITCFEGTVEDITARKRAEETLRESEQQFHAVWDNCADGMRLTDEQGIILAVNRAFCAIVGIPANQMLGKHFTSVYDPDADAEDIAARYRQRFAARTVRKRQEQRVVFKNGRRVDVALSNSFIETPGRPAILLSIFHDITERRRTEEALSESEVLYHSLVENLPQNIFRKDAQGRFTFVNSVICQAIGRPAEEILGKTDLDLFPEELATKYREDDLALMKSGERYEAVEEHPGPDGKRFVHTIKCPLRDSGGRVSGVQGMFWDVTQERVTEMALTRERKLLRALLDHIPDRIYFKDRDSRFLKINRALADQFGLDEPEDAVGKTDFEFFSKEHAQPAYEDEQRIILTGAPIIGKSEKETWRDGHATWALTTKMPLVDDEGHPAGTFGISRDITKLKEAEEELAKARDAALDTARLKAEFLAIMSHEIRTPMNGVIGMTGLLLDTKLNAEQRDYAETIRNSSEALLDIINDILDFSKIEAGKIELEEVDFDLRDELESTVELLAERAQSKNLELALEISDETPTALRGDPGRLRQVLVNLIGNAIKFTAEGEVIIRAALLARNESSVRLKLTVEDTGIGIPKDAQSRVFESFTQADTSTTRQYGGTGLGLAISRQLTEVMGGNIGVDSVPGEGSTFWVEMPFQLQLEPCEEAPYEQLDGLKVLIVDDNQTNRTILLHQTARWHMAPTAVDGGTSALIALREATRAGQPFDLVILDMHMPEMDGLSVARTILAAEDIAPVRITLFSSIGHRIDPGILRSAGIATQLAKPAKQSRLYNALLLAMQNCDPVRRKQPVMPETDPGDKSSAGEAWSNRPIRILLAEDNITNQKVALLQLRKLGLKADAVANGREVLEACREIPYDIILLDCHMPLLDGYQTAAQLRQREAAQGSKAHRAYVIALTANALEGDRELCLKAGMDDYITKPTRLEDLRNALTRGTAGLPPQAAPVDTASPEPISDLLDLGQLHNLTDLADDSDNDPLTELIDLFTGDVPGRLELIRKWLEIGERGSLITATHTLKGSASNLGARALAAACLALEEHAKAGELDAAAGALRQIESVWEQTRTALSAHRKCN